MSTISSSSEEEATFNRAKNQSQYEILLRGVETLKDCAIFTLTEEGIVSSWNEGARHIKRYEAHEIIGKHFSVFYPPEAQQQLFPWFELSEATKKGRFEDEGWRVRKDGSTFWANVIITAVKEEGRLLGFLKVTRDLTERKMAEQKLRVLERGVSEIKDYAIFVLSPTGIIMSWNAGALHIKQYQPHEIIGKHFSTFYTKPDIDRGWPEHELKVSKETGRFEDFGWRVRRDKSRFWANVIITPIFNDTGEHVGFTKVTRDLTEKRLAEQKLHTLELGTSELQDYAILSLDPERRVATWNRGAESMFGYTSAEAMGRDVLELCPDLRAHQEQLFGVEKTRQRVEGWWTKHDGVSFWADISSSAVFQDGEHSGYLLIAHDLTDKKKLEEERFKAVLQIELERKRTEDAKKHEKLQRDFTDRICHEVRNPLNGIYGSVELIVENLKKIEKSLLDRSRRSPSSSSSSSSSPKGSPQREDLQTVQMIKEEVETIAECSEYQRMITDEVLYLSDRGLSVSNIEYAPSSVVESVVQMYRATCEKKKLRLEVKLADNIPNTTVGDRNYVQQVLTNLVSNAIKFTSSGSITIGIEKVRVGEIEYIQYSVNDTGIGMNEDDMGRIFQRSAHGKHTQYKERPGSGLGLLIAKHLTESMGGYMTVNSTLGAGTNFGVLLPCIEPLGETPNKKRKTEHFKTSETPQLNAKALVVDDSSFNQTVVKALLERAGCKVSSASNGEEALHKFRTEETPFDIVLMDLTMPIMNGFEATKAIRQHEVMLNSKPVPIIALSGYTQDRERQAAKASGMNDYLAKPVRSRELFDKISSLLPARSDPESSSKAVESQKRGEDEMR